MSSTLDHLAGETRIQVMRLLRRSRQTISSLAEELGLSDNAVRMHVAALERDGLVRHVGSLRDTGGKPARTYALTAAAEELFPKAYAQVLGALVAAIAREDGRDRAMELLRSVGREAAGDAAATDDRPARVAAAAAALRDLGGDVDVLGTESGWRLQGYACPLSAVTATHPEVCELARALVEKITGLAVEECCDRSGRPQCGFEVSGRGV